MMTKVDVVRRYLEHRPELRGMQTFSTRNLVGDEMVRLYGGDGYAIDYCADWGYLEILGLSDEEYKSLSDILDIC